VDGEPALPTPSAALGPQDLAVLIAEGDATSEAIAQAYAAARGVPAANLVRVPVATTADVISAADFATLQAAVQARVPVASQALLVTWLRPSRVAGPSCEMGLTSALAFGFDARWCGRCATTAASPYYNSDSSRPFTDLGLRPAMMLGAADLPAAQALISRGLAADGLLTAGRGGKPGTRVTGNVWLVRTDDAFRNVRYGDFEALARQSLAGANFRLRDNAAGGSANAVTGQADVLAYWTGLDQVPGITGNSYLPGAVADHLTSYGGLLPNGLGQTTVLQWLAAGVTGSYGTVEEPCNFAEKFPRASVMLRHYSRGQTLIEAYWKSVQWPGQGLFVGEPLARPWKPQP
jgi:uncharacterized protein (TIGR03790 family)